MESATIEYIKYVDEFKRLLVLDIGWRVDDASDFESPHIKKYFDRGDDVRDAVDQILDVKVWRPTTFSKTLSINQGR